MLLPRAGGSEGQKEVGCVLFFWMTEWKVLSLEAHEQWGLSVPPSIVINAGRLEGREQAHLVVLSRLLLPRWAWLGLMGQEGGRATNGPSLAFFLASGALAMSKWSFLFPLSSVLDFGTHDYLCQYDSQ